MWNFFGRKPRVIPTFGIRIKESLEELDFDPDIIAKFEFPETPPWTYPTAMVNLTLSYAKKDQTDPLKYLSLHNEVKDVFRDYDFIYTDGSTLQMTRLQQQQSLIIILPLNVFQISPLYFLPSCMLSIYLLIGWRRQMMMKGILLFSLIQSLFFKPFRAKTGHILLSSTYLNASIG